MKGQEEKNRALKESFHQQSLTENQSRNTVFKIFINYLE